MSNIDTELLTEWLETYKGFRIEVRANNDGQLSYVAYSDDMELSTHPYSSRSVWPAWIVNQTPAALLASLIWGESRGESLAGQATVAMAVINRLNLARKGITWWGDDLKSIMLHPGQFDGLNGLTASMGILRAIGRAAHRRQSFAVLDHGTPVCLRLPY